MISWSTLIQVLVYQLSKFIIPKFLFKSYALILRILILLVMCVGYFLVMCLACALVARFASFLLCPFVRVGCALVRWVKDTKLDGTITFYIVIVVRLFGCFRKMSWKWVKGAVTGRWSLLEGREWREAQRPGGYWWSSKTRRLLEGREWKVKE